MKNVMIYNIVDNKRRHDTEELFKLFKMQIDNSLHYGWDPNDIVIGTNFEFEYKGISTYQLTDICEFNIFNNKWYGLYELMRNGILTDDIWFHDQDNWQVNDIIFPDFIGEIGASTYVRTSEWNTGTLFIKHSAIDILGYIVDSMKMNPVEYMSDENWISFLRQRTEISQYLYTLNTQYCVGYTYIDDRINTATGPIQTIAFVPNTNSYNAFKQRNLIPDHLCNIINTYEK